MDGPDGSTGSGSTRGPRGCQPAVLDQPLAHLVTRGRDEHRHPRASFCDLDRLACLDPVQVAAGVLAQLPDSDAFQVTTCGRGSR